MFDHIFDRHFIDFVSRFCDKLNQYVEVSKLQAFSFCWVGWFERVVEICGLSSYVINWSQGRMNVFGVFIGIDVYELRLCLEMVLGVGA